MNLNQIEKTYEYADKVYNNLMDKQEAVNLLFNDFFIFSSCLME